MRRGFKKSVMIYTADKIGKYKGADVIAEYMLKEKFRICPAMPDMVLLGFWIHFMTSRIR